jgi:hypothetical protein
MNTHNTRYCKGLKLTLWLIIGCLSINTQVYISAQTSLEWAAYLGGPDTDLIDGLALDSAGNVIVDDCFLDQTQGSVV